MLCPDLHLWQSSSLSSITACGAACISFCSQLYPGAFVTQHAVVQSLRHPAKTSWFKVPAPLPSGHAVDLQWLQPSADMQTAACHCLSWRVLEVG